MIVFGDRDTARAPRAHTAVRARPTIAIRSGVGNFAVTTTGPPRAASAATAAVVTHNTAASAAARVHVLIAGVSPKVETEPGPSCRDGRRCPHASGIGPVHKPRSDTRQVKTTC